VHPDLRPVTGAAPDFDRFIAHERMDIVIPKGMGAEPDGIIDALN
jgi:hypothetical protein